MRVMLCLICLGACATFPDVDDRVSASARDADFPKLLSLEEIDARVSGVTITDTASRSVAARVARLEARAALLRGAPVDDATRAELARLR